MAEIRVGTASWTDPGFIEDWYPQNLPASRRLRWYAEHFDLVEVNATFYALPTARAVERWCEETPAHFLFNVKLPKLLSRHSMEVRFLPPDLRTRVPVRNGVVQLTPASAELVAKRLLQEIQPLKDAGKLGALLLQMSPAFRPEDHRISDLDSVVDPLEDCTLAVELRNRHWTEPERLREVQEYFTRRGITFVLVDAPKSEHFTVMPSLDCITTRRLGYLRAHGRNESGYVRGRTVPERFDYEYSEEEIAELAHRLRQIEKEVERLHFVANNNRSNYAPRLAAALKLKLGLERQIQEKLEKQRLLL